jgi:phosphatidylglycerophosphatase A
MEAGRVPSLRTSVLTLFGVGYLPGGATLASLVAVAVWCALAYGAASLIVSLILFGAVLAAAMAELVVRRVDGDPKAVVVDEFLGMYAALLFLPAAYPYVVLALFIGFRVIDIVKPPPFSWIERWKHPSAILVDDIAIGLCLGVLYTGLAAFKNS